MNRIRFIKLKNFPDRLLSHTRCIWFRDPIGTNCNVVATVKNNMDAGYWSPIMNEIVEVARSKDGI